MDPSTGLLRYLLAAVALPVLSSVASDSDLFRLRARNFCAAAQEDTRGLSHETMVKRLYLHGVFRAYEPHCIGSQELPWSSGQKAKQERMAAAGCEAFTPLPVRKLGLRIRGTSGWKNS